MLDPLFIAHLASIISISDAKKQYDYTPSQSQQKHTLNQRFSTLTAL